MRYTTTYHPENSGSSCLGVFALICLATAALLGAAALLGSSLAVDTAAITIPKVVYAEHALKHPETPDIHECLNKNGANEIWRSFDKNTFYLLCQLPDGRWGFMSIIQNTIDRLWYEQTSYIRGDGSRSAVINYLTKWGTKFKGPFPWE